MYRLHEMSCRNVRIQSSTEKNLEQHFIAFDGGLIRLCKPGVEKLLAFRRQFKKSFATTTFLRFPVRLDRRIAGTDQSFRRQLLHGRIDLAKSLAPEIAGAVTHGAGDVVAARGPSGENAQHDVAGTVGSAVAGLGNRHG